MSWQQHWLVSNPSWHITRRHLSSFPLCIGPRLCNEASYRWTCRTTRLQDNTMDEVMTPRNKSQTCSLLMTLNFSLRRFIYPKNFYPKYKMKQQKLVFTSMLKRENQWKDTLLRWNTTLSSGNQLVGKEIEVDNQSPTLTAWKKTLVSQTQTK